VSPSPNHNGGFITAHFTNSAITKTRTLASSIALTGGNVIDFRDNRKLELLHDDIHSPISINDQQQDAIATNVQNT
jgi:hypothetical protein